MELKPQISPIEADLEIDLKASREKNLRQPGKSAVQPFPLHCNR
jgi:hypothetical protein